MKKFLEQVADEILMNYGSQTTNLIVILPNKRSEIFLKNYLKEKTTDTYWLPEFYTTDEFIIKQSGIIALDPILIYFELYEIHKELMLDKSMPIEDFLNWGPIMLSDFNDIDLQLADAEHIFKHLTEAKAIQQWNLTGNPLTELQSDYITFYQSLYNYYTKLAKRLSAKQLGYKGMIYKYLAMNIEMLLKPLEKYEFLLIGFNALSKSEKEIFGYLKDHFTSTFYWDTDEYYIDPQKFGLSQMEAGRFINELIEEWKLTNVKWTNNFLSSSKKEINIHGIAKQIGQVKFIGQQLSNWHNEGVIKQNKIDTAIVLADENLLIPLLHSLPELQFDKSKEIPYNVTMGYPLQNSSLSRFIQQWLTFTIKAEESKVRMYDVVQLIHLLKNPIVEFLLQEHETDGSNQILKKVTDTHKVYLNYEEIQNILQSEIEASSLNLFEILLLDTSTTDNFIKSLIDLMQYLAKEVTANTTNSNQVFEQQISVMYSIVKKVQTMVNANSGTVGLKVLQKIFNQLIRRSEISLKGEPLSGIQIMGMLETRNLDFKNVILLSANEGILPKAAELESFIPFDIRHDNKLPLPKEQNEIITYHFYRLLQRAENISILYNTDSDKFGSGEKSRFILQLENELQKINKSVILKNYITNIKVGEIPEKNTISIQKKEDVLNRIYKKAETGFSASALNVYRNCTLKFYFREILKLKEIEKIEPEIEFNVFGNAIHNVLEEIYKPFINKHIDTDVLRKEISNVDLLLEKEFKRINAGGNIKTGKNHLIYEVAKKYITQFLKLEIQDKLTPFKQISGLEERLAVTLEIDSKEVVLKGFLDRIEKPANIENITIIDYKTGKVEPADLTLKSWDQLKEKTKDKLFQLLFYAYLYQKANQISISPSLGIYSLRKLSYGLIEPKLPDDSNYFEEYLLDLLKEIFDPAISFQQTTDDRICSYCDYRDICNR